MLVDYSWKGSLTHQEGSSTTRKQETRRRKKKKKREQQEEEERSSEATGNSTSTTRERRGASCRSKKKLIQNGKKNPPSFSRTNPSVSSRIESNRIESNEKGEERSVSLVVVRDKVREWCGRTYRYKNQGSKEHQEKCPFQTKTGRRRLCRQVGVRFVGFPRYLLASRLRFYFRWGTGGDAEPSMGGKTKWPPTKKDRMESRFWRTSY